MLFAVCYIRCLAVYSSKAPCQPYFFYVISQRKKRLQINGKGFKVGNGRKVGVLYSFIYKR